MGDFLQARERYDLYGLATSENVDVQSLGARLLKDAALSARTPDPAALLHQVVYQDADDEHHAGDEQAQEQRIHRDAAATCLG